MSREPAVLIVDDDAQRLRLLSILFERKGYTALTASTADEALKIYTEHLPGIVITDYDLGEGTGCEIAREIRRYEMSVNKRSALYLSSRVDREGWQRMGFDGFLPKSMRNRELVEQVIGWSI